MSFYYKVGEKKYTVHWGLFALALIVFIGLGFTFLWCLFGGLYKFGGVGLCVLWVLFFGELTINGRVYTMIHNNIVRHVISLPCTVAAVIYYFI